MSDRGVVVLDASALIADLDANDAHHGWVLSSLRGLFSAEIIVSALTLAEAFVAAEAAGRGESTMAHVRALDVRVIELGEGDVRPLARLRAATRLRMPDAVVLHTAIAQGAELMTTAARLARIARDHGVTAHCP